MSAIETSFDTNEGTLIQLLQQAKGDINFLIKKHYAIHNLCRQITVPIDEHIELIDDSVASLTQHLPSVSQDRAILTSAVMLIFALESISTGRHTAFHNLLARFAEPQWQKADPSMAAMILQQGGWWSVIALKDIISKLAAWEPNRQPDEMHAAFRATRLTKLLGVGTMEHLEHLRPIVETVIVPWIKQCLDKSYFNAAIDLEYILYAGWLRRCENMDHYNASYALWAPMFEQAGLDLRKKLPPLTINHGQKKTWAIVSHNASWLAHIQVLYQSLRGMPVDYTHNIKIYFLEGKDEAVKARFAAINVECVFIDDIAEHAGSFDRLHKLREQCQKDNVEIVSWLCLATLMGLAFGMGLAPRQIYWCMKYPVGAFNLPDEFWVSMNGPTQTLDLYGKTYQYIPTAYLKTEAPDRAVVQKLRAQYADNNTAILGTLAREDKFNSPAFINTVCDILEHHPQTIYLYTGRSDLATVRSIFKTRGLSDRAIFVGWIDTRLYAEIFDIYLDSWPARSGMTAFNAFEAGKPYLFCVGDTGGHDIIKNHFFGIGLEKSDNVYRVPDGDLDSRFDCRGVRCLLACEGAIQYQEMADKLLTDKDFYTACSQTAFAFVDYLQDYNRVTEKITKLLENSTPQKAEVA